MPTCEGSIPQGAGKKRNSVCLDTIPSFRIDASGNALGLPRFDSFYGGFRKTRRFSDSTDIMAIPSVSTGQPSIKKEPYQRAERRNSMTAPKSSWPDGIADNGFWDHTATQFAPIPIQQQPPPLINMEKFLTFDVPPLECKIKAEEKQQPMGRPYYLDDMHIIGFVKEPVKYEQKKFTRKGAWTKDEDKLLIKFAGHESNKNKNWTEIAEKIPGRTAKQCRERWCFNLDPNIKKESWTVEEDLLLIKKQGVLGNKWAQIAQVLPGRTENAVKTRYKSILRARKREWKPHEDLLLLDLQQKLGANWEVIASSLDTHRTKHAVKMRFKELQAGLHKVKDPEPGNARQTVRKMFYPKESLNQVSKYYKSLADGMAEVEKPLKKFPSFRAQNGVAVKVESEQQQPFDDLFATFLEEDPLIFA